MRSTIDTEFHIRKVHLPNKYERGKKMETKRIEKLSAVKLQELLAHEVMALTLTLMEGLPAGNEHTVDEVAVVRMPPDGEGTVIYLSSKNRPEVPMDHLSFLLYHWYEKNEKKYGEFVSLAGQPGEDFDFFVCIKIGNIEYFVLGNYLDGTLEDLERNSNWSIARSQFVALAARLVQELS